MELKPMGKSAVKYHIVVEVLLPDEGTGIT